jgi:hypothetical protein
MRNPIAAIKKLVIVKMSTRVRVIDGIIQEASILGEQVVLECRKSILSNRKIGRIIKLLEIHFKFVTMKAILPKL